MDTVEVETKRFDSDGGKAPEPQEQLDVEQSGTENQYDKLAKEVVELRKANEILKAALGFFVVDRKGL